MDKYPQLRPENQICFPIYGIALEPQKAQALYALLYELLGKLTT